MADFFDRKEEVIDLKLTRHGRYLFSRGKLKPEYYAFFDDDIIYDGAYGPDPAEDQNNIVKRIREDTPRFKVQKCLSGVESDLHLLLDPISDDLVYGSDSQLLSLHKDKSSLSQKFQEKIHALPPSLGNIKTSSNYIPSWQIKFHKSSLESCDVNYTGSKGEINLSHIPQLETVHEMKTYIETEGLSDFGLTADDHVIAGGPLAMISEGKSPLEPQIISDIIFFEDDTIADYGGKASLENGAYITGKENYMFLEVEETNTFFTAENFEIEVFEVTKDVDGNEVLNQKYFFEKDDELAFSSNEMTIANNFPKLDDSYVEYWFDINVDKEIESIVFCETGLSEKKKDLYADLEIDMTCPDILLDPVYDDTVEEDPC